MQTEVKRLAVLQTGKVLAVLYGLGTAIIILPFIAIAIPVSPEGAADAIPTTIIMLVLYPLISFVGGIIFAALYNLTVKWVGGIRFTLEQSE